MNFLIKRYGITKPKVEMLFADGPCFFLFNTVNVLPTVYSVNIKSSW